MFDLEVFLYGFCYFDTISTKAIERWLLVFQSFSKRRTPGVCGAMSKMFVGGC